MAEWVARAILARTISGRASASAERMVSSAETTFQRAKFFLSSYLRNNRLCGGDDDAGDKRNLAEAISHVKFRGHDRTEGKETPSSSRFLLFFSPLINSPIRQAAKHELVTARWQFLLSPSTVSNAFLLHCILVRMSTK